MSRDMSAEWGDCVTDNMQKVSFLFDGYVDSKEALKEIMLLTG